MIETYELIGLQDALQEIYAQVGNEAQTQFELVEHDLALTFILSKIGHLEVEAKVRVWTDNNVRLNGSMFADQTYLPIWTKEVKNARQSFPLLD
ncbi:MAG TPA: hypothetical protein VHZ51_05140 [Ktedonobacteraceae bacterium]|nr:hypothetical protein [Ktedonobacteraceae bacterium]